MLNKKGMELSITFVVGLILGITMLSLGLTFAYRILASTEPLQDGLLPDSFELEAKGCVQRNEKLCIPDINKEITSKKPNSFGVVVNNIDGEERSFKMIVTYARGILEDGDAAPSQNPGDWTFADYDAVKIKNNAYEILEIPIKPPKGTKTGSYAFNVNICFDSQVNPSTKCPSGHKSLYSPTQQITVTVP